MPQRTRRHTYRNTLLPVYHYCALPFISPLLRVTGSKIWFPPHNSLHNAISPALNCQDNLYQSGGESPEWSSSYFSGKQGWGERATISTLAKPRTPRRHQQGVDARLCGGKTDRERFLLVTGRTLWASIRGAACRLDSSLWILVERTFKNCFIATSQICTMNNFDISSSAVVNLVKDGAAAVAWLDFYVQASNHHDMVSQKTANVSSSFGLTVEGRALAHPALPCPDHFHDNSVAPFTITEQTKLHHGVLHSEDVLLFCNLRAVMSQGGQTSGFYAVNPKEKQAACLQVQPFAAFLISPLFAKKGK